MSGEGQAGESKKQAELSLAGLEDHSKLGLHTCCTTQPELAEVQGIISAAHQVWVGEQVRQPAAAQVVRNLVWAAAAGHRHPHAQLARLQWAKGSTTQQWAERVHMSKQPTSAADASGMQPSSRATPCDSLTNRYPPPHTPATPGPPPLGRQQCLPRSVAGKWAP